MWKRLRNQLSVILATIEQKWLRIRSFFSFCFGSCFAVLVRVLVLFVRSFLFVLFCFGTKPN